LTYPGSPEVPADGDVLTRKVSLAGEKLSLEELCSRLSTNLCSSFFVPVPATTLEQQFSFGTVPVGEILDAIAEATKTTWMFEGNTFFFCRDTQYEPLPKGWECSSKDRTKAVEDLLLFWQSLDGPSRSKLQAGLPLGLESLSQEQVTQVAKCWIDFNLEDPFKRTALGSCLFLRFDPTILVAANHTVWGISIRELPTSAMILSATPATPVAPPKDSGVGGDEASEKPVVRLQEKWIWRAEEIAQLIRQQGDGEVYLAAPFQDELVILTPDRYCVPKLVSMLAMAFGLEERRVGGVTFLSYLRRSSQGDWGAWMDSRVRRAALIQELRALVMHQHHDLALDPFHLQAFLKGECVPMAQLPTEQQNQIALWMQTLFNLGMDPTRTLVKFMPVFHLQLRSPGTAEGGPSAWDSEWHGREGNGPFVSTLDLW